MRQMRLVTCFALATALAACGGGGSSGLSTSPGGNNQNPGATGTTPPPANLVTLTNQTFSPSTITVAAGSTVNWKWNDCSGGDGYGGGYTNCVMHNVTFDDATGIASTTQDQGTFSRTFATKGTYKYHCSIHGAMGMTGEVVVQ